MLPTEIHWLTVGQVGATRLEMPIYTIGSGKPVFGITCYVHGNESAGLFIATRAIDLLQASTFLGGTMHIILVANPAAQFINSRVASFDQKDLNRVGFGKQDGSFTERIGARLFEFLSQCDLVVNIHEFEMHTPTTAAFMNAGSTDIKKKTLAAIKAFSPEIIWVIDTSQSHDEQYQATLDTALAKAEVPNFPIETTQLAYLTDTEISRAAQGLLRIAAHVGIVELLSESSLASVSAFIRHEMRADNAGLWEPQVELMQVIEPGSPIGTLRILPELQTQHLLSPTVGILIQYRHRQVVETGTSLFSIGYNADKIISPYA
jgi:predicted deacylase